MSTNTSNKDRRDWTVFLILLPIGNQPLFFQPLSFDILTPMSWLDTFLTPGAGPGGDGNFEFQPFVVFEPTSTPSPAVNPTLSNTPPPTASSTPNPTTSPTSVWTPPPPPDDDEVPPPPALCTDPAANNQGSPLPCTYTPISSPLVGTSASVPANTNIGPADGLVGNVVDGTYVVVNLSSSPIRVEGPSETNYDFVYYEREYGSGILMDRVILSISILNSGPYYVVFNWGDGIPDMNSNVGDVASSMGTENDNQPIDQPDTGELYGTDPLDTGILVDVDNAPSHPPVGYYSYCRSPKLVKTQPCMLKATEQNVRAFS